MTANQCPPIELPDMEDSKIMLDAWPETDDRLRDRVAVDVVERDVEIERSN